MASPLSTDGLMVVPRRPNLNSHIPALKGRAKFPPTLRVEDNLIMLGTFF
ncbi:MAG TPA: hypothetical protein VIF64_12530 [Pyrinomonadaceae bacterium]